MFEYTGRDRTGVVVAVKSCGGAGGADRSVTMPCRISGCAAAVVFAIFAFVPCPTSAEDPAGPSLVKEYKFVVRYGDSGAFTLSSWVELPALDVDNIKSIAGRVMDAKGADGKPVATRVTVDSACIVPKKIEALGVPELGVQNDDPACARLDVAATRDAAVQATSQGANSVLAELTVQLSAAQLQATREATVHGLLQALEAVADDFEVEELGGDPDHDPQSFTFSEKPVVAEHIVVVRTQPHVRDTARLQQLSGAARDALRTQLPDAGVTVIEERTRVTFCAYRPEGITAADLDDGSVCLTDTPGTAEPATTFEFVVLILTSNLGTEELETAFAHLVQQNPQPWVGELQYREVHRDPARDRFPNALFIQVRLEAKPGYTGPPTEGDMTKLVQMAGPIFFNNEHLASLKTIEVTRACVVPVSRATLGITAHDQANCVAVHGVSASTPSRRAAVLADAATYTILEAALVRKEGTFTQDEVLSATVGLDLLSLHLKTAGEELDNFHIKSVELPPFLETSEILLELTPAAAAAAAAAAVPTLQDDLNARLLEEGVSASSRVRYLCSKAGMDKAKRSGMRVADIVGTDACVAVDDLLSVAFSDREFGVALVEFVTSEVEGRDQPLADLLENQAPVSGLFRLYHAPVTRFTPPPSSGDHPDQNSLLIQAMLESSQEPLVYPTSEQLRSFAQAATDFLTSSGVSGVIIDTNVTAACMIPRFRSSLGILAVDRVDAAVCRLYNSSGDRQLHVQETSEDNVLLLDLAIITTEDLTDSENSGALANVLADIGKLNEAMRTGQTTFQEPPFSVTWVQQVLPVHSVELLVDLEPAAHASTLSGHSEALRKKLEAVLFEHHVVARVVPLDYCDRAVVNTRLIAGFTPAEISAEVTLGACWDLHHINPNVESYGTAYVQFLTRTPQKALSDLVYQTGIGEAMYSGHLTYRVAAGLGNYTEALLVQPLQPGENADRSRVASLANHLADAIHGYSSLLTVNVSAACRLPAWRVPLGIFDIDRDGRCVEYDPPVQGVAGVAEKRAAAVLGDDAEALVLEVRFGLAYGVGDDDDDINTELALATVELSSGTTVGRAPILRRVRMRFDLNTIEASLMPAHSQDLLDFMVHGLKELPVPFFTVNVTHYCNTDGVHVREDYLSHPLSPDSPLAHRCTEFGPSGRKRSLQYDLSARGAVPLGDSGTGPASAYNFAQVEVETPYTAGDLEARLAALPGAAALGLREFSEFPPVRLQLTLDETHVLGNGTPADDWLKADGALWTVLNLGDTVTHGVDNFTMLSPAFSFEGGCYLPASRVRLGVLAEDWTTPRCTRFSPPVVRPTPQKRSGAALATEGEEVGEMVPMQVVYTLSMRPTFHTADLTEEEAATLAEEVKTLYNTLQARVPHEFTPGVLSLAPKLKGQRVWLRFKPMKSENVGSFAPSLVDKLAHEVLPEDRMPFYSVSTLAVCRSRPDLTEADLADPESNDSALHGRCSADGRRTRTIDVADAVVGARAGATLDAAVEYDMVLVEVVWDRDQADLKSYFAALEVTRLLPLEYRGLFDHEQADTPSPALPHDKVRSVVQLYVQLGGSASDAAHPARAEYDALGTELLNRLLEEEKEDEHNGVVPMIKEVKLQAACRLPWYRSALGVLAEDLASATVCQEYDDPASRGAAALGITPKEKTTLVLVAEIVLSRELQTEKDYADFKHIVGHVERDYIASTGTSRNSMNVHAVYEKPPLTQTAISLIFTPMLGSAVPSHSQALPSALKAALSYLVDKDGDLHTLPITRVGVGLYCTASAECVEPAGASPKADVEYTEVVVNVTTNVPASYVVDVLRKLAATSVASRDDALKTFLHVSGDLSPEDTPSPMLPELTLSPMLPEDTPSPALPHDKVRSIVQLYVQLGGSASDAAHPARAEYDALGTELLNRLLEEEKEDEHNGVVPMIKEVKLQAACRLPWYRSALGVLAEDLASATVCQEYDDPASRGAAALGITPKEKTTLVLVAEIVLSRELQTEKDYADFKHIVGHVERDYIASTGTSRNSMNVHAVYEKPPLTQIVTSLIFTPMLGSAVPSHSQALPSALKAALSYLVDKDGDLHTLPITEVAVGKYCTASAECADLAGASPKADVEFTEVVVNVTTNVPASYVVDVLRKLAATSVASRDDALKTFLHVSGDLSPEDTPSPMLPELTLSPMLPEDTPSPALPHDKVRSVVQLYVQLGGSASDAAHPARAEYDALGTELLNRLLEEEKEDEHNGVVPMIKEVKLQAACRLPWYRSALGVLAEDLASATVCQEYDDPASRGAAALGITPKEKTTLVLVAEIVLSRELQTEKDYADFKHIVGHVERDYIASTGTSRNSMNVHAVYEKPPLTQIVTSLIFTPMLGSAVPSHSQALPSALKAALSYLVDKDGDLHTLPITEVAVGKYCTASAECADLAGASPKADVEFTEVVVNVTTNVPASYVVDVLRKLAATSVASRDDALKTFLHVSGDLSPEDTPSPMLPELTLSPMLPEDTPSPALPHDKVRSVVQLYVQLGGSASDAAHPARAEYDALGTELLNRLLEEEKEDEHNGVVPMIKEVKLQAACRLPWYRSALGVLAEDLASATVCQEYDDPASRGAAALGITPKEKTTLVLVAEIVLSRELQTEKDYADFKHIVGHVERDYIASTGTSRNSMNVHAVYEKPPLTQIVTSLIFTPMLGSAVPSHSQALPSALKAALSYLVDKDGDLHTLPITEVAVGKYCTASAECADLAGASPKADVEFTEVVVNVTTNVPASYVVDVLRKLAATSVASRDDALKTFLHVSGDLSPEDTPSPMLPELTLSPMLPEDTPSPALPHDKVRSVVQLYVQLGGSASDAAHPARAEYDALGTELLNRLLEEEKEDEHNGVVPMIKEVKLQAACRLPWYRSALGVLAEDLASATVCQEYDDPASRGAAALGITPKEKTTLVLVAEIVLSRELQTEKDYADFKHIVGHVERDYIASTGTSRNSMNVHAVYEKPPLTQIATSLIFTPMLGSAVPSHSQALPSALKAALSYLVDKDGDLHTLPITEVAVGLYCTASAECVEPAGASPKADVEYTEVVVSVTTNVPASYVVDVLRKLAATSVASRDDALKTFLHVSGDLSPEDTPSPMLPELTLSPMLPEDTPSPALPHDKVRSVVQLYVQLGGSASDAAHPARAEYDALGTELLNRLLEEEKEDEHNGVVPMIKEVKLQAACRLPWYRSALGVLAEDLASATVCQEYDDPASRGAAALGITPKEKTTLVLVAEIVLSRELQTEKDYADFKHIVGHVERDYIASTGTSRNSMNVHAVYEKPPLTQIATSLIFTPMLGSAVPSHSQALPSALKAALSYLVDKDGDLHTLPITEVAVGKYCTASAECVDLAAGASPKADVEYTEVVVSVTTNVPASYVVDVLRKLAATSVASRDDALKTFLHVSGDAAGSQTVLLQVGLPGQSTRLPTADELHVLKNKLLVSLSVHRPGMLISGFEFDVVCMIPNARLGGGILDGDLSSDRCRDLSTGDAADTPRDPLSLADDGFTTLIRVDVVTVREVTTQVDTQQFWREMNEGVELASKSSDIQSARPPPGFVSIEVTLQYSGIAVDSAKVTKHAGVLGNALLIGIPDRTKTRAYPVAVKQIDVMAYCFASKTQLLPGDISDPKKCARNVLQFKPGSRAAAPLTSVAYKLVYVRIVSTGGASVVEGAVKELGAAGKLGAGFVGIFNPQQVVVPVPPATEETSVTTAIVVIIVLVVVTMLCAAGYTFLRRGRKKMPREDGGRPIGSVYTSPTGDEELGAADRVPEDDVFSDIEMEDDLPDANRQVCHR